MILKKGIFQTVASSLRIRLPLLPKRGGSFTEKGRFFYQKGAVLLPKRGGSFTEKGRFFYQKGAVLLPKRSGWMYEIPFFIHRFTVEFWVYNQILFFIHRFTQIYTDLIHLWKSVNKFSFLSTNLHRFDPSVKIGVNLWIKEKCYRYLWLKGNFVVHPELFFWKKIIMILEKDNYDFRKK
jgi:hypothetical protein